MRLDHNVAGERGKEGWMERRWEGDDVRPVSRRKWTTSDLRGNDEVYVAEFNNVNSASTVVLFKETEGWEVNRGVW